MIKNTSLCVLGLLLLGMLCVPVAAAVTGDHQGYWSFCILDGIMGPNDVKLNGIGESEDRNFQKVYVSDSLDQVEVQFNVTCGVDTTLVITKDYITGLQGLYPGNEPTLFPEGSIWMYDVDAGGLDRDAFRDYRGVLMSYFTLHEHLKKRGLLHESIGETFRINTGDPYERYVTS
jgi:hypothetical protein